MSGLLSPEKARGIADLSRILFFMILFLLVGLVLMHLPRLAAPLGLSYVFYLVLRPMIPILIKFGINRNLAILLMFGVLIFILSYPLTKIIPVIKTETDNVQFYLPKTETYLRENYQILKERIKEKTSFVLDDKYLVDSISYAKEISSTFLLSIPNYLTSLLEWVVLVPLFLFFLLKDGNGFKALILKLCPNSIFERFYHLFHQFNKQLGGYIFAKIIEASIVGIIITIGLFIMDVRFSFLLGIVAGVTNIIPYLGPVLGIIPALVFGLSEYGFGATFGAIMILYIAANFIDMALVFPILVSKIVDLHPVVVVVSVILGSQYLGVVGMIVSIPCAAATKLIFKEIYLSIYSADSN